MSRFSIRNPYLIIVFCLVLAVVGLTSLCGCPSTCFPTINIPVVVVATFFYGMPPEQIEADITGRFETLLHARQQYRTHRISLAPRCESDQGLLPARHRRRFRESPISPIWRWRTSAACRQGLSRRWS